MAPRLASAATLACARVRGAGLSQTLKHSNLPNFRALPDPDDEGHGVGRGGGEDTYGDRRQETYREAGASGMRMRERPQSYSSVRREGGGTRTVVRGK